MNLYQTIAVCGVRLSGSFQVPALCAIKLTRSTAWANAKPNAATLSLVFVLLLTSGCATLQGESLPEENDPFERFNVSMTRFNDKLDDVIIDPVYRGYTKVFPRPVRNRFSSFVSNLQEPKTVVNDVLQGKFIQAVDDSMRFVINTTVGIGGLFDPAKHVGLEKHNEDFGQTLAVWGVGPGPYVVLPLFGPRNLRDAVSQIPDQVYLDPTGDLFDDGAARWLIPILQIMDVKEQLVGAQKLLDMQLDPYVFTRESYRQRRVQQVSE